MFLFMTCFPKDINERVVYKNVKIREKGLFSVLKKKSFFICSVGGFILNVSFISVVQPPLNYTGIFSSFSSLDLEILSKLQEQCLSVREFYYKCCYAKSKNLSVLLSSLEYIKLNSLGICIWR